MREEKLEYIPPFTIGEIKEGDSFRRFRSTGCVGKCVTNVLKNRRDTVSKNI